MWCRTMILNVLIYRLQFCFHYIYIYSIYIKCHVSVENIHKAWNASKCSEDRNDLNNATTKNTESSPDSILDIHENCQIAYCYSNPSQAHSEIQYSFFFIYQLTYISDRFQGGLCLIYKFSSFHVLSSYQGKYHFHLSRFDLYWEYWL